MISRAAVDNLTAAAREPARVSRADGQPLADGEPPISSPWRSRNLRGREGEGGGGGGGGGGGKTLPPPIKKKNRSQPVAAAHPGVPVANGGRGPSRARRAPGRLGLVRSATVRSGARQPVVAPARSAFLLPGVFVQSPRSTWRERSSVEGPVEPFAAQQADPAVAGAPATSAERWRGRDGRRQRAAGRMLEKWGLRRSHRPAIAAHYNRIRYNLPVNTTMRLLSLHSGGRRPRNEGPRSHGARGAMIVAAEICDHFASPRTHSPAENVGARERSKGGAGRWRRGSPVSGRRTRAASQPATSREDRAPDDAWRS
jgi:hypothetical protein